MMEELEARGRLIGERAVEASVARLAAAARTALPGLEVEPEPGRVTLAGRGLVRRWLSDPALRWMGGLLR